MTGPSTPVTEEDLHAYVDRRLDDARKAEVAAHLEHDADAAAMVRDYQAQNAALHARFDPVLDEPVPPGLASPPANTRGRRTAWAAAAALGVFLAGVGGGWLAKDMFVEEEYQATTLVSANVAEWAAVAHVLYVPEVRHPVEVAADEEAHLVGWLTKRLGGTVRAPDLSAVGYRLVGGRLLPSPAGPAAQLMYENGVGGRLTLYLASGRHDNRETAFRYLDRDGVGVFYWIDGPFGYALTGETEKDELLRAARLVYEQLKP